ncbi:MAG: hypothetical protein QOI70_923 [Microbacteriaceae bacterium]|jgi:DNA-binding GntR family transcriptional regulator|nr:hypothetical protein [Microbacteriaceae bacterium]
MPHQGTLREEERPVRVVSADVYGKLTAMILRNDLLPGSRINIDGIAQLLRVSATPVREALARLESDGLVTKIHLKGYRTTNLLTKREIDDLYEFRLRIEPFSAARAASVVSAASITALKDELATFPSVPTSSNFDSYKEFSAHDARLHHLILELSGNDVILRAFEHTHCHLHAFRLAYDSRSGHETIDEHKAAVDAIINSDSARAEEAMRRHLEHSRDRLLPLAND